MTITVDELLKSLEEFQDFEKKGFPTHLKTFKEKSEWVKQQKRN
tara:strand:- start:589 stop:720 length:132 start_codon:yes stop_codon:yes gene_type:complete